jgi:hypothetical protein
MAVYTAGLLLLVCAARVGSGQPTAVEGGSTPGGVDVIVGVTNHHQRGLVPSNATTRRSAEFSARRFVGSGGVAAANPTELLAEVDEVVQGRRWGLGGDGGGVGESSRQNTHVSSVSAGAGMNHHSHRHVFPKVRRTGEVDGHEGELDTSHTHELEQERDLPEWHVDEPVKCTTSDSNADRIKATEAMEAYRQAHAAPNGSLRRAVSGLTHVDSPGLYSAARFSTGPIPPRTILSSSNPDTWR